jgi:hypothetical protein
MTLKVEAVAARGSVPVVPVTPASLRQEERSRTNAAVQVSTEVFLMIR